MDLDFPDDLDFEGLMLDASGSEDVSEAGDEAREEEDSEEDMVQG